MRIAKWGNSLAVRLPAALVRARGLKEGDEVQITITKAPAPLDEAARLKALKELRKFRGLIPADFKFDREEVHERGAK